MQIGDKNMKKKNHIILRNNITISS